MVTDAHKGALVEALADAFLEEGAWTKAALARRAERALGERPSWLARVARRVDARFHEAPRSDRAELVRFIASLEDSRGSRLLRAPLPRVRRWPHATLAMGAGRWPVPPIATVGDLADWLSITASELEWFADARGLERLARSEALQHYRYRWVPKRRGGVRLLEAPKERTKAIQRRILAGILDGIPPHEAAHGFRHGRSVRTHAAAHVGRAVVVRLDLADFFLSVPAARVAAIFHAAGYPSDVAWALACLTTNRAPSAAPKPGRDATAVEIAARRRAEMLAKTRHLPQGAPTSPALANLAAFGLDVRLRAAADAFNASYTRYADDLVFSSADSELARRAGSFVALAAGIATDEGFVVNHRKTRVMTSARRQLVTGVVVNTRLGVPRPDYELLEAILTNCVRRGPLSQDRASLGMNAFRDHLRGRVAWVRSLDARRGERLAAIFERIAWPEPPSTEVVG